jgi:hypothetical protein
MEAARRSRRRRLADPARRFLVPRSMEARSRSAEEVRHRLVATLVAASSSRRASSSATVSSWPDSAAESTPSEEVPYSLRHRRSGVGVLGGKIVSIMRRVWMVSARDNEIYIGSGLRGVIPYVQCGAAVFPS